MMKLLFFKRFEPQKSWKRHNLNCKENFNLHGILIVLSTFCDQITNLGILSNEFNKCLSGSGVGVKTLVTVGQIKSF